MSVPTRAGFSQNPTEFREFETQWGLYSIQVPLQPIGRLYWENSGLSEISTQTLGNMNIHWFGGGVRGTPVIDVRGVYGASDLVGFTEEGMYFQIT